MKLSLDNAIAPIFVLIWSTGFVIARMAMPYVEPATFLFWRFAGVLAAMAALSLVWRITWPSRSQIKHIAIAGILLQFGYLMGVWVAVRLGMTAGLVALIVGLQPILTAWFAAWVSEKVTTRQWIGLVFGFMGVALVVAAKVGLLSIPLISYFLAFAALLSITFGTIYQKKFCPIFDLRAGSTIQFGVSAILSFFCMYFFETGVMVWNASVIGALLWAIFPISIGSISLLFMMIRKGAATKVTSLLYLTPPTTAAMAWLLFDEPFTLLMAVGLCLTMTGVVLVNARQTNTVATIAE
ncbi:MULTISPECIES: DMT family transporter [unclassified Polynucleobacter]|uniref:DMT family transporter n=1 Tax=unclassified Polynucleobacter TaxID=2640945 RepID=UPI001C0D6534|nr:MULTISPECIES: DMT family transporter [unclassified Polynucleobacter]MBU3549262.1 DMT family transporter [Polynucleobacter sp. P1-05-14]MBU3618619.1 DMT family transporter [Polynucleobacter sp. JS-Fieb-80-E5]